MSTLTASLEGVGGGSTNLSICQWRGSGVKKGQKVSTWTMNGPRSTKGKKKGPQGTSAVVTGIDYITKLIQVQSGETY